MAFDPFRCCLGCCGFAVVETNDVASQSQLRLAWMRRLGIGELGNLLRWTIGQQSEPFGHQFIWDAHGFGKLIVSRFADADVIAQTLTHTSGPVEAAQDRQSQAYLRLLSSVFLQAPANH